MFLVDINRGKTTSVFLCQAERSRSHEQIKPYIWFPMYTYYVYILKCCDGSYYTGITNNIAIRLAQHQHGIDKYCYTYKSRPLTLKFQQEFNDVLQAIYFEKKIKGWTRAKKVALINGDYDMLKILSECRNATHFKYQSLNK
ncbi:Excinuclease ABC C subunit domain protein [Allomuricauda ruestringensis DSM 13258]|uniref:Excinuclease ABC C subunit domain protein n=1 Tax=Allomuricauda ruestringensis (strain DSM 13258 / CIP 107369 / LMG 19739 / B1) TaxID=886377 RepID=G2PJU9_ALLRU|nr:Excinuclease ABC C subunit domain protein [Allomuricauda ruestringensis DSM 13258]